MILWTSLEYMPMRLSLVKRYVDPAGGETDVYFSGPEISPHAFPLSEPIELFSGSRSSPCCEQSGYSIQARFHQLGAEIMGRKLFVGNFPYETGEAELESLFAQAGTIDTVRVMRDMATGRARGFAFVEMQSDADAQAAIQRFNGTDLGGRPLVVNEAKPKPQFGGGDGPRRRTEPRW